MAKTLNKLSPLTIKSLVSTAKKEGRVIKAPDGGGLYFVAEPERSSWWRFDYRINGKQKTLSVGLYPEISVPEARARRSELREQVANAIDPSEQRKAERASQSGADSLEPIAREWWEHKRGQWTEGHAQRTLTRLVNDVFPYIGKTPINSITAIVLLETIRRIESRGAIESAHRTNQACEGVFAYAIGTGRCENNPATAISSVLKPAPPQKNFARLTDIGDISRLLNDIETYKGSATVRSALQLLPLTFVRPGELAKLEWADIDFDKALWTVPAHVKKQSAAYKSDPERVHIVPLSRQAIALLRDMHLLTGGGRYVFTGLRTASGSQHERHMAMEALLSGLRRMGYDKDEMTAHGFRGIASTKIREIGKGKFREEVIEAQLAHSTKSKTQKAYDHAEYLEERTELMQWWADYLDGLKNGAQVIPFKKAV
ncbi:integrase arm-type DNA-binding domain-containing protein [Methylovulum sp.]|uniref:tyrosine-type recombinase/integrase n=1 Tax=Methylovulum sp. TaxID=1916980 RepID=UPI002604A5FF|nr:integrase arm-type DNA-binding domain-containing protein [Methylovulum sp.]MDD5126216.1 tyrosine-type recombinase/integrase [Methylovulum sp.]